MFTKRPEKLSKPMASFIDKPKDIIIIEITIPPTPPPAILLIAEKIVIIISPAHSYPRKGNTGLCMHYC